MPARHSALLEKFMTEYGHIPPSSWLLENESGFWGYFIHHREAILEKYPQMVLDRAGRFQMFKGGTAEQRAALTAKYQEDK